MSHEGSAKVSLGDRMRADERLSNIQIDRVLRGVLASLKKMHEARPPVLHGAITPDAIFVDEACTPTLVRSEEALAGYRAGPRRAEGYSPIEQVLGRPSPSSDLYALAMSLVAAGIGREPGSIPIDPRTAKVDLAKALPNLETHVHRALEAMLEPVPLRRVDSANNALAMLDGRGSVRGWTIATVALLVMAALAVVAWRSRAIEEPHAPLPSVLSEKEKKKTAHDVWAAYSKVTADLNGDDVREVIGWDHSGALFAIDGSTGALLWDTSVSSRSFSVGDALILGTPDKEFEVTAIDPKTGHQLWQKKLTDEMYSAGFGNGCIALNLRGDERLTFGNDGTPKPCPDAYFEPSKPYRDRTAPLIVDGLSLLFSDVGAGTSRLSVERIPSGDGGAVASLWKVTLDVASEQPNDDGVSLTRSGLLLTARDREKNGYHAFLLDPDTGATKRHSRLCGYVNVSMPRIQRLSRDLVKIQCEGEVAALHESTLEVEWTAGRSSP